ncbi:hypothetical protein DLAC_02345 [Tieghemostelium lacteum]|uniref:Uncharacterized protein n=1 Tax=Tieghemostelium lacteum TaxID=361077 RepID=A0A152A569_TIELA|nr:hypothetical protein DLAC_02345 [Tieghemostelium lacteum]|eukprot:KYR01227.1 hypothetical protein DLAC_02345 [Tieghemostelium lacteum]
MNKINYNDPSLLLFNLGSNKLKPMVESQPPIPQIPNFGTSPVPSPTYNNLEPIFNNFSSSPPSSVPNTPPVVGFPPASALQKPSGTSSPSLNGSNSSPMVPQVCYLSKCALCERGQPPLLLKTPTWASIMRVVFYCLHLEYQDKEYFSLKTDVYEFMTCHWDKLYINKKRSDNWRKQVQDMLSHSKNVFESGLEKVKQNGYWKLKYTSDPWVIRNDESSYSSLCSSPKKRHSFDIDSNNKPIVGSQAPNTTVKKLKQTGSLNNSSNSISVVPDNDSPSSDSERPISRSNSFDSYQEDIKVIKEEMYKLYKSIPQIREKVLFEKQIHNSNNNISNNNNNNLKIKNNEVNTNNLNIELQEMLVKLTFLESKLNFIQTNSNSQSITPTIKNTNNNSISSLITSDININSNDTFYKSNFKFSLPLPNQFYNRSTSHPYNKNTNSNNNNNPTNINYICGQQSTNTIDIVN